MNRFKSRACLLLLQGSKCASSDNLLQSVSKCRSTHLSERTYFLNLILGDRKFNLPPHIEKKREENTSFQSFSLFEAFKTRQERRSKICDLLACSPAEANEMLQRANSESLLDDSEMFFDKLKCLHKGGLDISIILNNMWLFSYSLGDLEKKLEVYCPSSEEFQLKEISLLKLPRKELIDLIESLKHERENNMETRIDFFSREFNLTVAEICHLLVEHSFLRRKDLNLIKNIYAKLKEAGVTSEEIKNDVWVFKRSLKSISERIEIAKEMYDIENFKCWMSRVPLRMVERAARISKGNKEVLNEYHSKEELLMRKLELTAEETKRIIETYPQIGKTSERKLKDMLDFLLAEGFTPEQITRHPRILCHSQNKLITRINELRKLNIKIEFLYVLGRTQADWEKYIEETLMSEEESQENSEVTNVRKSASNRN